jgi:hypothetical protein
MPYDAFIRYCSDDKKVADAVCGTLEVPGIELEKGFAVRKSDRALLQELDTQLAATPAARDGVSNKSIPGWGN